MIRVDIKKLQYDINRGTAKISPLSSDKNAKYKYPTDEKILPSNKWRVIEQAKFKYFPQGKALKNKWKQLTIKK